MIDGLERIEGGLEHIVFFRKKRGRIFKLTKAPKFGHSDDLFAYVQNLVWCNQFTYDDILLEGIVLTPAGVAVLISQPYVVGREPTEEQIREWFEMQGARRRARYSWEFPNGMIMADANLRRTKEGSMIPIDVQISFVKGSRPEGIP